MVVVLMLQSLFLVLDDDRFGHCDLFAGKSDVCDVAQELPTHLQHARTAIGATSNKVMTK